jgi:hypothetical protein
MTAARQPDRRRRQLAAIHAAKRDLRLDDDTYRDLLERLTGVRSAAELGPASLDAVLDYMAEQGWRPRRVGKGGKPLPTRSGPRGQRAALPTLQADQARLAAHRAAGAGPQEALILALWDELAEAGAFKFGRAARLDTFMARLGGDCAVAHPRFLTPAAAQQVIEGLRAWLARVRRGKR